MCINHQEKLAYTPNEARRIIGVGKNTIYQLISTGVIEAKRVGCRKWIIPRKQLENWLNNLND